MPTTTTATPRWLYRFFAFINRLPIPAWLLGLLVIVLSILALHLEAWRRSLLFYGVFSSYLITISLYHILILGVWIFLDQRARLALTSFFKKSNKRLVGLESAVADFISLPSWLATIGFLMGLLFGYFTFQSALRLSPLAGQVFPAYGFLDFVLVSGLLSLTFFRAIRQAVLLRRLYRKVEVNIFNPAPLYALTRYSSQTSLVILLLNYTLILFSLPGFLLTGIGYFSSILVIGSALTLFFAPLTSINRRMADEKERLLSELGQDLEDVYARVHKAVRRQDYPRVNRMRNTIATLKDGWDIVKKIPTWPWEPETLRNLLTPLLLPVIVYLTQRLLGSLFGF